MRVIETDPALNRKQLLSSIQDHLVNEMHFEDEQIHLTGMLVLYNNMLQSLFRSQILTIGAVFVAIFLTFIVLFRSLKLACLGIIPSIFSAILILGIMGWFGVPLDAGTVVIGSLALGIAVDDTIHLVNGFHERWKDGAHPETALADSISGVLHPVVMTTIVIALGFGLIGFSGFVLTRNVGLLLAGVTIVCLLADLFLLPALLLTVRRSTAAV